MNQAAQTSVLVRVSHMEEVSQLNQLITQSARELSKGFYTDQETEAAIEHVFGVDTALVKDGSYFTAEIDGKRTDAIVTHGYSLAEPARRW